MTRPNATNTTCDLSFILRCRDDEERIGHTIQRVAAHLRGMGKRFELLLCDEGSGDNTLAVAALLRSSHPELEVLDAPVGQGFVVGAERARGRVVVAFDVRSEAPLAALGYALSRLERGLDVLALGGRFLVFQRSRSLRALDALSSSFGGSRNPRDLERRFVRRARALGLPAAVTHPRRERIVERIKNALFVPRAFSFLL
jgi:glycosyltransferase involved in cell wall biosynthesis